MEHATDQRLASLDGLSRYKVAEGDPDVRGWDVIGRDGRRIGEVDDLLVDTAALKVRYLEIRLDQRLVEDTGAPEGILDDDPRPTGTTDLRGSALPELDPLREPGEIQGHLAAPNVDASPTPVTPNWGETLVRQSLSDVENRMTADDRLGEHPYAGERHILVPIGRARLDTDEDRILVDSLTVEQATSLPPYQHGALEQGYEERISHVFGATGPSGSEAEPYGHEAYDERTFYTSRGARSGSGR